MKTVSSIWLLPLLMLPGFCLAQVYTPPAPSNNPTPNPTTNSTTIVNQPPPQNNQPVVGNEVPFFDMRTNTFEFNGKQFNVKQNDVFRARFEKFLSTAEATDEITVSYRKAIDEILEILSPLNKTVPPDQKLSAALARMEYAATFEQDARICDSLINAVFRLVLTKQNQAALQRLNGQLDKERINLERNFKVASEPKKLRPTSKDDKGNAIPTPGELAETERFTSRIAEKEKERLANLVKMEVSEIQARLEFQSLIVQLFLQRRFEHVVMATRLYTHFYRDGSGKLDIKDGSELEKTFSQSIGFSPTIATLDAFSNEAIRDIKQQVDSFMFFIQNNEIDAASTQLQQAFITGEYLPSVQNVPREAKRKVQTYARNAFKLTNAFEVRDFALASQLVDEMKEQATDFDASRPSAAIETAKLTSSMKLRAAKKAFLENNEEEFKKMLAEATTIWPTNPDIKTEFNTLSDVGDTIAVAKRDFDKLMSTSAYREIYNDRERFSATLYKDEQRGAQLRQVAENILEIQIALEQAATLRNANNHHAAWELIESKFKKFPDDVPLSAKLSELTPDVADFARALSQAKKLKENGQRGSSLAWYLAAKKIYPQSTNANEGIDNLVDEILPVDNESASVAPEGLP